ncbi:hypothetical protein C8Q74DRAFT_1272247 [Fomes fomentarius]|nr:hypothetical protein C8Q74DRAFT_1272247 [Fomes fomentarius]
MSEDPQVTLFADFNAAQVQSYVDIAIACLMVYEYAITFEREVELFLRRKFTLSSSLFVTIRYLTLAISVLATSCAALYYIENLLSVLQYLPWALFSALRAYALSSGAGRRPLSILILLCSIVPLIVNFVDVGSLSIAASPDDGGCDVVNHVPADTQAQVFLIASDLLVMGITWRATYQTSREIKTLGHRTSLSNILVLAVLNTLHLTLTLFSIFSIEDFEGNNASVVVNFTEPLTAILISRFLMDIQEASNAAMHQHSQLSSSGDLGLTGMVGSLSSPLPAPGVQIVSIHGHDGEPVLRCGLVVCPDEGV